MKRHPKQPGKPVIQRRRIRNQKNKNDYGRSDFKRLAAKAFAKKLRHRRRIQMLRHNTRSASQHNPCQKGADNSIADAGPCRRNAKSPSKLSGIPYKHNRREIRCSISKRRKPGSHGTASQNKAVDIGRMLAAVKSNPD